MISREEVKHIAKLARLELTEKEIKKMQADLSEILDYFKILKKAPLPAKILQRQNFGERANTLRIDEPVKSRISDKILDSAPDRKDGYLKVKSIL